MSEPPKPRGPGSDSDSPDDAGPEAVPSPGPADSNPGAVLSLPGAEVSPPTDDEGHEPAPEEVASAYDVESLPRGTQLGRFVLLGRLSDDGDDSVLYGAYDPQTDQKISLKLFDPGGAQESELRLALVAQAQAVGKLDHPCVERIYEAGVFGPWVFLATEFIDGIDVQQWMEVRDDPFPWPEVLRVFREAGRGLAAAHAAGTVHRDFRPGNILMGEGRIVVTNFGFAPELTEHEGDIDVSELRQSLAGSSSAETEPLPAAMAGTPAYMAPEQHVTGQADARSDQFSFCVALYEALYGERPFSGSRPRAIAREAAQHNVRSTPGGSDVPDWLRAIVVRGLSPRPSDRFPSMEHLLRELGRDPAARRRRWAWGAAAALTVAAGAGVVVWQVAAEKQACEDTGTALDEVWTTERRHTLRDAFTASDRPWAAPTWSYTEANLDSWASQWRNYSHLACMSTRVWADAAERTYELRVACLDRKLEQFDATVGVLESVDGTMVDHAHDLATHLPEPRRCTDTATLFAVATPAVEEDTESIDELHGQLAALEARIRLRDLDTAKADADAMLPTLQATDDAPLLARHRLLLGMAAAATDADTAAPLLHEAAQLALRHGDQGLAATAWQARMKVLTAQGRYDEALALGDYVEGVITQKRFGWLTTELAVARGNAHFGQGSEAKALAEYYAAVEREENRTEPDPVRLVPAWLGQADILLGRGEADEALAPVQTALEAAQAQLGPTHPITIDILARLGATQRQRGETGAARTAYDAALQIAGRVPAVSPDRKAELALAVGRLDAASDRLDSALVYLTRADKNAQDPRLRGDVQLAMALVQQGLGRPDDAIETLIAMVERTQPLSRLPLEVVDNHVDATLRLATLQWDHEAPAAGHARVVDLRRQLDGSVRSPGLLLRVERWLDEHPAP